MNEKDEIRRFETTVLPHLNAAYNLARWLTRNDHDAEDVVQMAFVRAFKFFDGFQGGNARAWLLTIVRRTFYTSLRDSRFDDESMEFDEAINSGEQSSSYDIGNNPEHIATSHDTSRIVNHALEQLPELFREILILKEMEELSYKEIAEIVDVPIGTVMSRLARARKMLMDNLRSAGVGGSNGV